MVNKYSSLQIIYQSLSINCSWTYSPGQTELHKIGQAEKKILSKIKADRQSWKGSNLHPAVQYCKSVWCFRQKVLPLSYSLKRHQEQEYIYMYTHIYVYIYSSCYSPLSANSHSDSHSFHIQPIWLFGKQVKQRYSESFNQFCLLPIEYI